MTFHPVYLLSMSACLLGSLVAQPEVPAITARMQRSVEEKEVAGVVALVADRDKILHFSASGASDLKTKTPMLTDSLVWIASMTKPITGTAVMMMQEEGRLNVTDPVTKYLPEFANLKDAAGNPVVVTIQQCLTHTSGLSDLSPEELYPVSKLETLIPIIASKAVRFPPGSKWDYCQSGFNVVGRIVEIVSGMPFDKFLQARIFDPLEMKDTTFYPTEAQLARLAKSYKRTEAGDLEESPLNFLEGKSPLAKDRYPRPHGGLFSTAADYLKFSQMLLRGGELGGKRLLKPETVKLMTTIHTGDIITGFTPGNGWGLGSCVVREPQDVTRVLSPGTFGHGGAYGTQAWIDPVKNRIYILLLQRSDSGNGDASAIREGFQAEAGKVL